MYKGSIDIDDMSNDEHSMYAKYSTSIMDRCTHDVEANNDKTSAYIRIMCGYPCKTADVNNARISERYVLTMQMKFDVHVTG